MTTPTLPTFGDLEGALRTYLRGHTRIQAAVGQRVFFGLPKGVSSCITLGQSGGGPGPDGPLEVDDVTFSCWASHNPAAKTSGTKAEATAIKNALVTVLQQLQAAQVADMRLGDATGITVLWAPDESTEPTCPRYVVHARISAVQTVPS